MIMASKDDEVSLRTLSPTLRDLVGQMGCEIWSFAKGLDVSRPRMNLGRQRREAPDSDHLAACADLLCISSRRKGVGLRAFAQESLVSAEILGDVLPLLNHSRRPQSCAILPVLGAASLTEMNDATALQIAGTIERHSAISGLLRIPTASDGLSTASQVFLVPYVVYSSHMSIITYIPRITTVSSAVVGSNPTKFLQRAATVSFALGRIRVKTDPQELLQLLLRKIDGSRMRHREGAVGHTLYDIGSESLTSEWDIVNDTAVSSACLALRASLMS